jgi:hypothetical protein
MGTLISIIYIRIDKVKKIDNGRMFFSFGRISGYMLDMYYFKYEKNSYRH